MTLVAFVSLAYAWWRRRPKYFNSLPLWRQIIGTIGILAVTLQALLFLLSFSKDRSRPYTFRWMVEVGRPNFFCSCALRTCGKQRDSLGAFSSVHFLILVVFLYQSYSLKTRPRSKSNQASKIGSLLSQI